MAALRLTIASVVVLSMAIGCAALPGFGPGTSQSPSLPAPTASSVADTSTPSAPPPTQTVTAAPWETPTITPRFPASGALVATETPPVTTSVAPDTLTAVEEPQPDLVGCGGSPSFPAAVFDDPNYPDAPAGPERDALPETTKVFDFGVDATAPWRLAYQGPEGVMYVTQHGSGWISAFVHQVNGKWMPGGMGNCQPMTALPDGLGGASWALDPAYPRPKPNASELHIIVYEFACADAEPAVGRIAPPVVTYTDDTLTMAIGVTAKAGNATCEGPAPTPATVLLPQPLGHRTLLHGIYHPAQPPKPL